jgi:ABC-type lipoprotein release transport system permease subunit
MALILKIAWRNIFRHKSKSLVIGAILFLGALVMTVGNGVVSGMDQGLRRSVVDGFMGDVVIMSDSQETDDVLLSMMGKAIEPINNYKAIAAVAGREKAVESFIPVGKNMAMVLNEDGGTPGFAYLVGVDFKRYREMFPDNFKIIEGRAIGDTEKGMLVPTGARLMFFDYTNIWFIPESTLLDTANLEGDARKNPADISVKKNAVFMGFNDNNSTNDIRLPVTGVIRYRSLNKIWGHFVLVDIESYRQCLGYFSAAEKSDTVPKDKAALLESSGRDLDALFSEDNLMVANTGGPVRAERLERREAAAPESVDVDAGAYNLVFVRLKKGEDRGRAIKALNAALKQAGAGARAVTWEKAAGMIGSITVLIKTALFVFVMFLFLVAIIVIVNTLSMAALERVSEIGMMRAVGARKGFISRMFLAETAMLSFVFGGLGIAAGGIAVKALSAMRFVSDNDMVQLFYGGDTFHPLLTGTDVLLALLQLGLVTLISVLYPLKLARSITPLDAITRD